MVKTKKVICAMSGGVDSSVATALFKKNGYEVVGVFMLTHKHSSPNDAKKVADKIRIPFYVIDARKEFKKRVVDYLIKEYKRGRTPNPCVECNKWIKFKFLLEKALQLKADYIATGHYARIKREIRNPKSEIRKLMTAKDKTKDQSYFLWQLNQKQLSRVLFPIGDYTKKEVRQMAKKFGLPVFEKRESQEICFTTNLYEFLKSRIHTNKGPIITNDGKKIGEHEGLAHYTIGQRKGIKIGGIGPFYVVKKDFKNNALIVAQSEQASELFKKEMVVKKVNWITGKSFRGKCKIKIRYMTKAVPAVIKGNKVVFDKKQRAITPGQSAVFYKNNELLGGGIIC